MRRVLELQPQTEFAIADRRLLRGGSGAYEVWSLSPSSDAIHSSHQAIASLLPSENSPKRKFRALTPNSAAVVTLVVVGEQAILLGSDLEEIGHKGWTSILASHGRPSILSTCFKVPHHGSSNAHHGEVWSQLLEQGPQAVLTPFRRGKVVLPTQNDLDRIRGYTDAVFLTSKPNAPKSKFSDPVVEKTMREATRSLRAAQPALGHVRLRRKIDASTGWTVALANGAFQVKAVA